MKISEAIIILSAAANIALNAGCASGPLMAYELHGTWCSDALPSTVCLTVDQTQTPVYYTWTMPGCLEVGHLTGGLEFSPSTAGRLCLTNDYDLYSAAGEWMPTGIRLYIDGQDEPFELHYQE